MKRIYPIDFPKQTECRLDRKHDGMGHEEYLLVDFRDETVIFRATYPERTLTGVYKQCQFHIQCGWDIDTWIPSYCGRVEFKKFDNLRYK